MENVQTTPRHLVNKQRNHKILKEQYIWKVMFSVRDKGTNKKVKLISFRLVIRINVSNYFNIILFRLVGMKEHRMVTPPPPPAFHQTNISIHILHTIPYKFLLVLTRRICLTIKVSLVGDHFLYSHDLDE